MKRAAPWEKSPSESSDDSSDSDSEDDGMQGRTISQKDGGSKPSKVHFPEALDSKKKKLGGMNFEALSKHGYHGGPSVLKVPPPKVENKEQDWSWSTGKGADASKTITQESYVDREQTRASVTRVEQLLNATTNTQASRKDKHASFSQKEKRKRDLGQASRGKNYVEEEKRLLRDSGVYSGFDS